VAQATEVKVMIDAQQPFREDLPMPAWREPKARRNEIWKVLTFLSIHYPEYLKDPTALTAPPKISPAEADRNISAGYTQFGHEHGLTAWNHLVIDIIPHISEVQTAIADLALTS